MSDNKIVVFDLDETLGYFTQIGNIWETLYFYLKDQNSYIELTQTHLNNLFDLFPEYIRHNIE